MRDIKYGFFMVKNTSWVILVGVFNTSKKQRFWASKLVLIVFVGRKNTCRMCSLLALQSDWIIITWNVYRLVALRPDWLFVTKEFNFIDGRSYLTKFPTTCYVGFCTNGVFFVSFGSILVVTSRIVIPLDWCAVMNEFTVQSYIKFTTFVTQIIRFVHIYRTNS